MINKVMYAGSNLMPRNNASKVAFGDYGDDLERSLKGDEERGLIQEGYKRGVAEQKIRTDAAEASLRALESLVKEGIDVKKLENLGVEVERQTLRASAAEALATRYKLSVEILQQELKTLLKKVAECLK